MRSGQQLLCKFENYDKKEMYFKVKFNNKKEKRNLREIASICFDTSSAAPKTEDPVVDEFVLSNNKVMEGVFKGMDSDKIRIMLLKKDFKEIEIPIAAIKRINFSLQVLDVHRKEFGKGFNLFGKDIEIELAKSFASDIETETQVVTDTLVDNYINRLGRKIASFSKRADLHYEFKVVNSKVVNAFTVGGGRVFVNRGLIEQMDNESELAGVLAHEIGHNVGKHVTKQLSKTLLINGISALSNEIIKAKSKKWSEVFDTVGGLVSYFSLMKFSRDDEREADYLGVYNLYLAGYDPDGMVTLFQKFKKLQHREPSKFEVFFQTHPKPSERKENTIDEISKISKIKEKQLKNDNPSFRKVKQYLSSLSAPIIESLLVNQNSLVDPNAFAWNTLSIDLNLMKNCILKGSFVASGGSRNDIIVLLLDQTNFMNWKNGHQAFAVYNSGQTTAGDIELPISESGNYYLVLNNTFSIISKKAVNVQLSAIYNKW